MKILKLVKSLTALRAMAAYVSKHVGTLCFKSKYLLGIDNKRKCASKVLTLFSKLVKTNTTQ